MEFIVQGFGLWNSFRLKTGLWDLFAHKSTQRDTCATMCQRKLPSGRLFPILSYLAGPAPGERNGEGFRRAQRQVWMGSSQGPPLGYIERLDVPLGSPGSTHGRIAALIGRVCLPSGEPAALPGRAALPPGEPAALLGRAALLLVKVV
jgi:hypothetical protein